MHTRVHGCTSSGAGASANAGNSELVRAPTPPATPIATTTTHVQLVLRRCHHHPWVVVTYTNSPSSRSSHSNYRMIQIARFAVVISVDPSHFVATHEGWVVNPKIEGLVWVYELV